MVQAWIYDEKAPGDQRAPHQFTPNQEVSLDVLSVLGVLYWKINPAGAVENPLAGRLGEIRKERNYKNHDVITISREKLPNYDEKLKTFFEEHLHEDEEIRFCIEGSGNTELN